MINKLITALKPTLRLALFLSYPLLVLFVLGWFLIPFTHGYLKELAAFLLLTLICTAAVVIVPNGKLRQWLSMFFVIILSLLCFTKLSFYQNYDVKLSSSALFVIFETNATEASDFLKNYFNLKVIGVLIILLVLIVLAFSQLKRFDFKNFKSVMSLKLFALIGVILSIVLIHFRFSEENIFIKSATSYKEYVAAKSNLKANLAQEKSTNIEVTSSEDSSQTYVVIIGESTSRRHMQLYGYERETNPLLTNMKDDLLIYNNVITTNVHTILALDKILTLSDFDSPNSNKNASVVQLANAAGFDTYWISNQKPVGLHESIPTLIGSAAKEKFFLATNTWNYDIYDENILPILDDVLNKKAKKKVVFIHLIGTHASYKKRYPETFNYFKADKENTIFKSNYALSTVNEYDNSIRYNDYIVSKIINEVKKKTLNSFVLYFSDHGDEVYDTIDYAGHNEFNPTKAMYEVPFLVWFSEEYKLKNMDIINNIKTNRPYILEDFIHSFSELSNIEFIKLDKTKSIFNEAFINKPRLILDSIDYDLKNNLRTSN